ncbi:adenosylmethionine--8-amino-7-oxononanoate transaminase [compost metagenome]
MRPIGKTVYFMPPYIIEESHMRQLVDATLMALTQLLAGDRPSAQQETALP